MKKLQKGSTGLVVLIAVIVLVLIAGGVYVKKSSHVAENKTPSTNNPNTPAPQTPTKPSAPAPAPYVPATPSPAATPASTINTSNWKMGSLAVDPGKTRTLDVRFPVTWGVSELSFSCANPQAKALGVMSPIRRDLAGYENVSVAYLVQFCVAGNAALAYQGFVKLPLTGLLSDSDKITLNDAVLKSTPEYPIGQQISASAVLKTQ